jgi:hypothetical protein
LDTPFLIEQMGEIQETKFPVNISLLTTITTGDSKMSTNEKWGADLHFKNDLTNSYP